MDIVRQEQIIAENKVMIYCCVPMRKVFNDIFFIDYDNIKHKLTVQFKDRCTGKIKYCPFCGSEIHYNLFEVVI